MATPKLTIDAVKLRLILTVAIIFIAAASIGVYIYASSQLRGYSETVQAKVTEAEESQNILSRLETTEIVLNSKSDAVERAAQVVAESQKYRYQDQIITDLNRYANRANITIKSISFGGNEASGSGGSSSSSASASDKKSADNDTGAPSTSGLKSVSATIDLETPISYKNFLQFLSYIEQNLTKMQIKNVGVQKASEGNGVTVQSLTIEVYTR